MIHLPHAGIGVKEVQKEGQQENHADFGPKADAKPDDEQRRQSGARNAVEGDDDRLENIGEKPAAPEGITQGDARNRADRKADGDLFEGNPGVLEQVAVAENRQSTTRRCGSGC